MDERPQAFSPRMETPLPNDLQRRGLLQRSALDGTSTPARYLGCLGPRARAERLVSELAGGDVELAATYFSRLHAPAGLDIGAENATEIALSIISEIRAVLVDRDGGSLRNRLGPIHEFEGSHERLPSKVELACALKGN